MTWQYLRRPGYFGRRRDDIVGALNNEYGEGNWRLVWRAGKDSFDFLQACVLFYEESYLQYLEKRPADLDFICEFAECIGQRGEQRP